MSIVRRKSLFTLIELCVAIALISVLLTTLFGMYRYLNLLENRIDKEYTKTSRIQYLQTRLGDILPKAIFANSEGYYFYTTQGESFLGESLVFTFDNGIDILPWFSNCVLARLYVDKHYRLCLAIWPLPKLWKMQPPPMRKEILFENVERLFFYFYMPPYREKEAKNASQTIHDEEIRPIPDEWNTQWKKEFNELPALVKVKILLKNEVNQMEEKAFTLAWPLPYALSSNKKAKAKTILYHRLE